MTRSATKNPVASKEIDLVEGIVKGLIAAEIDPANLLIGVHNAFCHGQILKDVGFTLTDKQLGQLFDGFEMSIKAMRKILKKSGY